jgi:fructokinase
MKAARDLAVVGLGELLWDELPKGRRLGGAPANFAVMASRLGVHGIIASRLGEDERGDAALGLLATLPVDSRFLQSDPQRASGSVSVTVADGQPEYEIRAPVAWDALELTPAWLELAGRADAVCWGTLAQRDARSEETIHGFLTATRAECLRVFDVNLRAPFFTAEAVVRSLARATLLKLNDGEMPQLLALASLPAATEYRPEDDAARAGALTTDARRVLAVNPGIELVAITLGEHGSLLVARDAAMRHRGIETKVVDTVGAGDAFTAALAVHRLMGKSLAVQSEAANRWGSWVAGQTGAMPALGEEMREAIEQEIEAAAEESARRGAEA